MRLNCVNILKMPGLAGTLRMWPQDVSAHVIHALAARFWRIAAIGVPAGQMVANTSVKKPGTTVKKPGTTRRTECWQEMRQGAGRPIWHGCGTPPEAVVQPPTVRFSGVAQPRVGVSRTSVLCCRRPLTLAAGSCGCCQRCCQSRSVHECQRARRGQLAAECGSMKMLYFRAVRRSADYLFANRRDRAADGHWAGRCPVCG